MYKEIIIAIIIIILIFVGNFLTQDYTKSSVEDTTKALIELRNEIANKSDIDTNIANKNMGKVYEEWNKKHDTLAYYIEHDELEKVDTNLTGVKSFMESKEYTDAVAEIDKAIYILKHIEEKNKFSLVNVF